MSTNIQVSPEFLPLLDAKLDEFYDGKAKKKYWVLSEYGAPLADYIGRRIGLRGKITPLNGDHNDLRNENLWSPDLWETPDQHAQYLANLVQECANPLELSAGNGQVAKYLLKGTALEILEHRYLKGSRVCPQLTWINGDFLRHHTKYDGILGNPPFSLIEKIFKHLPNVMKRGSLAHLLIPTQSIQCIKRFEAYKESGLNLVQEHKFINRIAFIRDGEQIKGTQQNHSVFTFGLTIDNHPPRQTMFIQEVK
ncbi:putative methyltransferase [Acaryochloris phage A-HIS2]|nr:putative methyltransferase [Acaryochloris phage A-HIS2]